MSKQPENILCVDTATRGMSVATFSGGACVVTRAHDQMRDQASRLLPFIVDVLKETRLTFQDLDALVVATGPGSFTGIRVGLAAMQGIALAADLPLIGYSNFDIYALQAQMAGMQGIVIALESHRKEAFCQYYDTSYQAVGEPFQTAPEGFVSQLSATENILVTGNAETFMQDLPQDSGLIVAPAPENFADEKSAQYLGKLFFKDLADIDVDTLAQKNPAEPFYIRPPDVTFPKKGASA